MKLLSALAIGGACCLASGCSLFSTAEYGPTMQPGEKDGVENVIKNLGAPDVVGGNGKYMVLGWRRAEALSILGLFQSTKEKSIACVIDDKGFVVPGSAVMKDYGSGLAIFGPISPLGSSVPTR